MATFSWTQLNFNICVTSDIAFIKAMHRNELCFICLLNFYEWELL